MRLYVFALIAVACARAAQLESSMSPDPQMPSFRFKGFATTTTSTSTVFSSTTTWLRATKTCKLAGTPSCNYTPPPAPPATSSPAATTVSNPPTAITQPTSVAPTQTATTTVTATPLLQINVNKLPPKPPGINLVQMMKPINVSISAGITATAVGGKSNDALTVAPSAVNSMEMTASPEMRSPRTFDLEASHDDSENEYELIGLGGESDSVRFFNKITIAHVKRTTVTVVSTATSTFPVVAPTDQVTVAYGGCIPKDAPLPLPDC